MVLSDNEIMAEIQKKGIVLDPFDKENLQPASYDLKVGSDAFVNGERVDLSKLKAIKIPRGSFAVLTTIEKIGCGTAMCGRFGLRSYFARKGLVLLSGIQIDPGYEGSLTAFLFNLGPEDVIIQYQDIFATVEFSRLGKTASFGYRGQYQGQTGIPARDLEDLLRPRPPMSLEGIEDLLKQVRDRQSFLSRLTFTMVGALITVFGILISFAFYVVNVLLPLLRP